VAHAPVVLGFDNGQDRALATGETLKIDAPVAARVRYVAVRGAFDVPRVLGSKSTLLVAHLGGFEGRPLKRGDRLRVGSATIEDPVLPPTDDTGTIRVVTGPDLAHFAGDALDQLFAEPFTISPTSDRTGTRLDGPALPRIGDDVLPSMPMVRGAIEITADGRAIVLGPDHPTTGGYPVIACVITKDFGRIMRARLGTHVRFAPA
jgi:allophanate hydrolase subunit 2